ncbi:MAG: nucleotide sugar dehydrogenase, partial [Lysobacteraceae bacterium]
PDLRNSKIADLIAALQQLGHSVDVHDPLVSADEASHEYGIDLVERPEGPYDLVVLAVPHRVLVADFARFADLLRPEGGIVDIRNVLAPAGMLPGDRKVWTM